ncbi:MAG TPA: DUF4344 domain-containing metallopeptidase [Pseudorhodoplanes sp.]|nr:DUF4344 domain-containing metallopeptidase [Pseudorhodoplanes sp.]
MSTAIWIRALAFGAAAVVLLSVTPAFAQIPVDDPRLKTNQFDIQYVEPKNPAHIPIYEMKKKSRILEGLQEFLSPFRLPKRITIKIEGCDGVINSYFEVDTIKICYEYLDYMQKHTPKSVRQGLTPHDALIGPTLDVFLHEWGHGIVRVLDIPFFAKEEDVADALATYILLSFAKDDARRLILGASFFGDEEVKEEHGKSPELSAIADSHSLPAQRYYNRWCLAYGYDKELFADAIEIGMLPPNRVRWCRWEWDTNADAFVRLIKPYIDQDLMKKVMAKRWFEFESPVAATMAKPKPKDAQAEPGKPAPAARQVLE